METFLKELRKWVIVFCIVLFIAGALWNLCCTLEEKNVSGTEKNLSDETVQLEYVQRNTVENDTIQEDLVQEDAVDTIVLQKSRKEENEYNETLENRIAALRIARDSSYQQLYHALEQQEFPEKQKLLQTYATLQYKEHRLELLLSAKGMEQCLVILETNQANIIVPEELLQKEYETLYDLVFRNTEYAADQIVLVPIK